MGLTCGLAFDLDIEKHLHYRPRWPAAQQLPPGGGVWKQRSRTLCVMAAFFRPATACVLLSTRSARAAMNAMLSRCMVGAARDTTVLQR